MPRPRLSKRSRRRSSPKRSRSPTRSKRSRSRSSTRRRHVFRSAAAERKTVEQKLEDLLGRLQDEDDVKQQIRKLFNNDPEVNTNFRALRSIVLKPAAHAYMTEHPSYNKPLYVVDGTDALPNGFGNYLISYLDPESRRRALILSRVGPEHYKRMLDLLSRYGRKISTFDDILPPNLESIETLPDDVTRELMQALTPYPSDETMLKWVNGVFAEDP